MSPHRDVVRALPDLLTAHSASQLKERIQRCVSALGFDYFLIGSESLPADGASERVVETDYPSDCVERYRRHNWLALDPVVRHCRRSPLPLIWHRGHFSGAADPLYEASSAQGIACGVATALRSPRDSRGMMLSLACGERFNTGTEAGFAEALPVVQLLACYTYEAIDRFRREPAAAGSGLTRREGECLRWAAAGKTSWEISRILGCSEATVNFHFRNAIHKLGVSNRLQAVARALSLGLVQI